MKYTYMIGKSGKKGKEWTNAQKGKTRTGHLDPWWMPTQGIYSEWVREGGTGEEGVKKNVNTLIWIEY